MALGTGAAIALGISGASGLIGNLANASAQDRARLLQEKGVQEFLKLRIPDPAQLNLALERFVSAGELSPQLEEAVQVANTEFENVTVDPRLKESRLRALGALEDLGSGGETIEDAAALEANLIRSGSRNRGAQEAVLGSMARRGQLGTGLELAGRMGAAQSEGDRLAMEGLEMEKARRERALNALIGSGELAGRIQSDDYNMASDKARAKDMIAQFNAQNMQGVRGRNVDRSNNSQQFNLTNAQNIADKNVGVANFQQQYNKELDQQRFNNEAKKAAGVSGQYGAQAESEAAAGANAAKMWGGIASGAGTVAAGLQDRKSKDPFGGMFDDEPEEYAGDNFNWDPDRDRYA